MEHKITRYSNHRDRERYLRCTCGDAWRIEGRKHATDAEIQKFQSEHSMMKRRQEQSDHTT